MKPLLKIIAILVGIFIIAPIVIFGGRIMLWVLGYAYNAAAHITGPIP